MQIKENLSGPLGGYRILEFAANYTGPYGAMLLGDQGAEVIKVESPSGDQMRYASSSRGGMAASFINANRNKRSIRLDMKTPEATRIFKKLVMESDVVIQNFRPGVVERMGLGYDDLKKIKEDIIMVSISGYGPEGPYADRKAYDPVIQGVAGVVGSQIDFDSGSPGLVKNVLVDKITGVQVSQAVTAALLFRERSGKGQHVRVNMLDVMVSFLWVDVMLNNTFIGEGATKAQTIADVRCVYKTKDHYIVTVSVSDDDWRALVTAIGRPELVTDERFHSLAKRSAKWSAIYEELKDSFLHRTTGEWMDILTKADAVCAPVNMPDDLCNDPQIISSEIVWEGNHPAWGAYRQAVHPVRFLGSPASIHRHAPLLGEHSEEVLCELGYREEEIAGLKKQKII